MVTNALCTDEILTLFPRWQTHQLPLYTYSVKLSLIVALASKFNSPNVCNLRISAVGILTCVIARAASFRDRWNDSDSGCFHCLRLFDWSNIFQLVYFFIFLIHLLRLIQLDTIRYVRYFESAGFVYHFILLINFNIYFIQTIDESIHLCSR